MKKYTLGVTKPEYWQEIHNLLCESSSCEHIPDREVLCVDEKEHSPTMGTFELDEDEVEKLKNNEKIEWIELCPIYNPDSYMTPIPCTKRFKKDVRIYRAFDNNPLDPPTSSPTSVELDRTSWHIKRSEIKKNEYFWPKPLNYDYTTIKNGDVSYSLTGKNVDVVIQDGGILQYHPEFMNSNGKSRVLDIVLDGPYHIDPEYFDNVIPAVKYTKADGRVGIATTSAREWWNDSTKRSSKFSTIGVIGSVPAQYTVPNALGTSLDGTGHTMTSGHGNACAGIAAGKNMGLAFEANVWNISVIASPVNIGLQQTYDLIKLFHKYKPINTKTGLKNPTIVNASYAQVAGWSSLDTINYRFRGSTGSFIGNCAVTDQVTAMKDGLNSTQWCQATWCTSDGSYSMATSGKEMMDSGVIFVAAAGNNNQRLGVGANDPDRLNYMDNVFNGYGHTNIAFGGIKSPCNHRDWCLPQNLGFDSATDFHPAVCVGAMSSFWGYGIDDVEGKSNFSNNGPGVDVWAPGEAVLTAGIPGTNYIGPTYIRYDDSKFYDCQFSGTSCAAPVVVGLIALYLETNPTATSKDVKYWLKNHGSVISYFNDPYPNDTTTGYWTDRYGLRGAEKRIYYNPFANDTKASISDVSFFGISFDQT
jgi:hypothetical protein